MAVEVKADRVDDALKAVAVLTNQEVLVGIPADKTGRSGGDGIGNACLGYIHEFGSPAKNIPARPFLVPGVRAVFPKVESVLQKAAEKAFDGNVQAAEQALNTVGLMAQSSVQKAITDGEFVPLRPATIAARRRKGFSGDKPLIVSGQLLRSITYVVRQKGKS